MNRKEFNPFDYTSLNPWLALLSLVLISLAGMFLFGGLLGFGIAYLMEGMTPMDLQPVLNDPESFPQYRPMLLAVQGMNSLGGFILSALIYYYTVVKTTIKRYFTTSPVTAKSLWLTFLVVFSFMIVNTFFSEWNANLELPRYLSGFESWARGLEDRLKIFTDYLTQFNSMGYFLFAVLVIGILPAVGEEFLFRGLLQNLFMKISASPHVAIWLTAFLFGALHFQFYGLVPRMLLGVLFGYLYLWSGNLLIPIFAHFINNALSLFFLYIYQMGLTDIDMESTEAFPGIYLLSFAILGAISIYYFRTYYKKEYKNG
jgi:membrane protease YdiL (CAAX protease family)